MLVLLGLISSHRRFRRIISLGCFCSCPSVDILISILHVSFCPCFFSFSFLIKLLLHFRSSLFPLLSFPFPSFSGFFLCFFFFIYLDLRFLSSASSRCIFIEKKKVYVGKKSLNASTGR